VSSNVRSYKQVWEALPTRSEALFDSVFEALARLSIISYHHLDHVHGVTFDRELCGRVNMKIEWEY